MQLNPIKLVVRAKLGKHARNLVWDTSRPLGLGHPFRWIMERTPNGIRVRDIAIRGQELVKAEWKEIPYDFLRNGEITFPKTDTHPDIAFQFKPARAVTPSFLRSVRKGEAQLSFHLFARHGQWIHEEAFLDAATPEFVAHASSTDKGRQPLFRVLLQQGAPIGTKIKISLFDTALVDGRGKNHPANSFVDLTPEELEGFELVTPDGLRWSFTGTQLLGEDHLKFAGLTPAEAKALVAESRRESETFKRLATRGAIALAAMIIFSFVAPWILPKQVEEAKELIPPQFAKVLLEKHKRVPEQASQAGSAAPSAEAPAKSQAATPAQKKAQNTAVAQAFRSQALQSAVKGLLKGGMTKLLEQSDVVMGHSTSADAKRMLDSRNAGLNATAPEIGDGQARSVAVAGLGGDAGGAAGAGVGANANAVGYGKGKHAAVSGQGKAFVSMDLGDSSVEEGLTKDEVGEVIHKHLSEVRYCYEAAMIRQPDIEGKLMIHFIIGAAAGQGAVKSAEVTTSTLSDPKLDDCVVRRLVTWKFPLPKGGVDVNVTYPFIFKTLGR